MQNRFSGGITPKIRQETRPSNKKTENYLQGGLCHRFTQNKLNFYNALRLLGT